MNLRTVSPRVFYLNVYIPGAGTLRLKGSARARCLTSRSAEPWSLSFSLSLSLSLSLSHALTHTHTHTHTHTQHTHTHLILCHSVSLALQGVVSEILLQRCPTLLTGLQPAAVESLVSRLVRQDKCNSFGYIAPYSAGKWRASGSDVGATASAQREAEAEIDPTERSVRASGVFPLLALANHSCMPTVYRERLRLDSDSVSKIAGCTNSSRRIAFRAMSDCSAT